MSIQAPETAAKTQTFKLIASQNHWFLVPREAALKRLLADSIDLDKGLTLRGYQGHKPHAQNVPRACKDCLSNRIIEAKALESLPIFQSNMFHVKDMTNGHSHQSTPGNIERCLVLYSTATESGVPSLAGAVYFEIKLKTKQVNITQLAVAPELQGKGYGKILMNAVLLIACEYGCSDFELETTYAGAKLYFHYGFYTTLSESADSSENDPEDKIKKVKEEILDLAAACEHHHQALELKMDLLDPSYNPEQHPANAMMKRSVKQPNLIANLKARIKELRELSDELTELSSIPNPQLLMSNPLQQKVYMPPAYVSSTKALNLTM